MKKRVLMIAFHFPPARASGVQRSLGFAQHLPEFGWDPIMLSAHPRAYEQKGNDQLSDIPKHLPVHRPFCLDAARHLAIYGRYSRLTALPDRWSSWWLGAVPTGLNLIRHYKPQVIWSTYPIATSLKIGSTLHKLSGLPWIADFRDPMVLGPHPHDPTLKKVFQKLEKKTILQANQVVVTTPGLQTLFQNRYPTLKSNQLNIITNGYDEQTFQQVESTFSIVKKNHCVITLLHSGTLYPGLEERDINPFLDVIATLKKEGKIGSAEQGTPKKPGLRIILRASGRDEEIQRAIQKNDLENIIFTKATRPYREALQEMYHVDGLLLFQGSGFNHLIPAKLFEYLRSGQPLLAMVGPEGDSAQILNKAKITTQAPLRDQSAIRQKFFIMLNHIINNTWTQPNPDVVQYYSRRSGSQQLAHLLDKSIINPGS